MARANKAISLGIASLIVIALIFIVVFGTYLNATFNTTSTTTIIGTTSTSFSSSSVLATSTTSTFTSSSSSSSSSSYSTVCIITGQPGPFFLRIVSDSNATPISGAQVAATNQPASVNSSPCGRPTTVTFTTTSTVWYSLATNNNAGYSFMVTYSGQKYNFTASLGPLSVTCATLFIPSGRTNITITEFQTTCSSGSTTATPTIATSTLSLCGGTPMTTISSTLYCMDNVSNVTLVPNPGYAYFLNGSVTFMGVTFRLICSPIYLGCPGTSNVTQKTTVTIAVISAELKFSDRTNETIGGVMGISSGITVLSKHTDPAAGIMISRTGPGYQVNLLVQPTS